MSSHGQILDEDRLRQIARSIRDYVPRLEATAESCLEEQTKKLERLLDDVFWTSNCATLAASHRVAAWNTLCCLIDRSLQSDVDAVRTACWSFGIWARCLGLYLNHAQIARPKSSRQLLLTLTNALRKALSTPNHDAAVLSACAIRHLLDALQHDNDPFRAKASAQLLATLLQKDVISVASVLAHVSAASDSTRASIQALLATILGWLGKGDFGSTVATTISIILDKVEDAGEGDLGDSDSAASGPIWLQPLQNAYHDGTVHMNDLRAHLLPVLFKRKFGDFVAFLGCQRLNGFPALAKALSTTIPSESQPSDELLYAALQTAKALGLLLETDSEQTACTPTMVLLPVAYIDNLMFQSSRSARLAGLWLLVLSPSVTRPLSPRSLQAVKKALAVFFADVDADFRSEVFGALQRLTDRLRSATKVLSHQSAREAANGESSQLLEHHRDFLKWLQRFLAQQLRPTASYQRHISALKCISILARSGLDRAVPIDYWSKSARGETRWTFHTAILTADLQRLLLDLIMDPFDDVRQTAASILHLYCVAAQPGQAADMYRQSCERAERQMYLSGRADQADGVAHLHSLIHKSSKRDASELAAVPNHLQELVEKFGHLLAVADRDLSAAVERYPLHGLLTSLRLVLDGVTDVQEDSIQQIYDNLVKVWKIVKPILCDDAPEGYLPEELEQTSNDTKETLSYCWRALKESSLLLSSLIARQQPESPFLEPMSELCFTQLSELRHRGAFSTVAQTWTSSCIRCQCLRRDDVPVLRTWYERVIDMLHKNVTINTRRSAGLPSLLCGILIGDPSGALMSRAFVDLEAVSRQRIDVKSAEEGSLPQVHALNCMKEMVKNSALGETAERHVPVALRLATDALQSDVWAMRNCGLMLFRAAIDRLLGTSAAHLEDDAPTRTRVSGDRHPQLLHVVLRLLAAPAHAPSSMRYEGVFPALQLLQLTRVAPEREAEVKMAVRALTGAPSWHVRDKAARTLSSFEDTSSIIQMLEDTVAAQQLRENALHGALLIAGYTLARTTASGSSEREASPHKPGAVKAQQQQQQQQQQQLDSVGFAAAAIFRRAKSPIARAAALDVLRQCSALGARVPCYDQRSLLAYLSAAGGHGDGGGTATAFEEILRAHLHDASGAPIRQAWARLVAQYLLVDPPVDKQDVCTYRRMVQALSQHDQNAHAYLLAAIQDQLDASAPVADWVVVDACLDMAHGAPGVGLVCEAQKTVLKLCRRSSGSHVDLAVALRWKDALGDKACNEQCIDDWLQLFAMHLDRRSTSDTDGSHEVDENLLRDIIRWVGDCAAAISGEGVHSREAAAEALDCIRSLWSVFRRAPASRLDQAFLKLTLAVQDLLNDDDEDMRLRASRVTSRMLKLGTRELEPITSRQKLLGFCMRRWKSDSHLIETAFQRAFGSLECSVAEQLSSATARERESALFAEEKQNLYVDEAQEARIWARAIPGLDGNHISREAIARAGGWVVCGLDALTEYAQTHADGALAWSTQADIFVLGLRVVYGAEVLFDWAVQGVRIPIKPPELRRKLFACLTSFEGGDGGGGDGAGAGRKRGCGGGDGGRVNCLWRWEIERVLQESVAGRVRGRGQREEEMDEGAAGSGWGDDGGDDGGMHVGAVEVHNDECD